MRLIQNLKNIIYDNRKKIKRRILVRLQRKKYGLEKLLGCYQGRV
jgi:hypothetical protein